MKIYELTDPMADITRQALDIYEQSFPLRERVPTESLLADMQRRPPYGQLDHFWAMTSAETDVVTMAIFSYFAKTQMAFIGYLAVRTDMRGSGLGSRLFRRICSQPAIDAATLSKTRPALGICFEVERPSDALSVHEFHSRQRRILFFQYHGAILLDSINYAAPPVPGMNALPYYLMFKPGNDSVIFSATILKAVIDTVFHDEPQTNPYYQVALKSLG